MGWTVVSLIGQLLFLVSSWPLSLVLNAVTSKLRQQSIPIALGHFTLKESTEASNSSSSDRKGEKTKITRPPK